MDAPCGSKSGLVFYHGVTPSVEQEKEEEENFS